MMANESQRNDNLAFNAMYDPMEDSDRMFVEGGAFTLSEYEHNMTPKEQKAFENTLVKRLELAYARDPYKQNLDFNHWLKTLKPELYRERSKKMDDIRSTNFGTQTLSDMNPLEAALLDDASILQRLAHLHTGRIEDLIKIAEVYVREKAASQGQVQPLERSKTPPKQSADTASRETQFLQQIEEQGLY